MAFTAPPYVPGHQLLAGKSVLITAAAGAGIGFAAARRAVEEGARAVVISDVHEGRLGQAAETLQSLEGDAAIHAQLADVTDEAAVRQLVMNAEQNTGGIDILINNAGLGGSRYLVDMTDEEWHRVIDITLNGTMRMTRAMLRVMQPRGSGVIVNNASVLGWRAQKEQCHYAAAKAGVIGFTKALAQETARKGITVNCIAPGYIDTDMVAAVPQNVLDQIIAGIPVNRLGKAEEIGAAVEFLCGENAGFITGATLSANGGQYVCG